MFARMRNVVFLNKNMHWSAPKSVRLVTINSCYLTLSNITGYHSMGVNHIHILFLTTCIYYVVLFLNVLLTFFMTFTYYFFIT